MATNADTEFSIVMTIRPFSHHHGAEFNNLQRFMEIGMVTWERFFPKAERGGLKDFFVIAPKADVEFVQQKLKAQFSDWPWKVIHEDQLLHPGLPSGWAKQQTAKLAVSFLVQTELYLIIDDDTYLTKPFFGVASLRDAEFGNKILMNRIPIDFPFFFLWSAQVLGYDFDKVQEYPYHMAITPEVFVTSEVRDLVKHLIDKYGDKKTWQVYLVNNKFTEYCLYWIWLIMRGKNQTLYVGPECPRSLYGNATTGPEHNLPARVEESFKNNKNYLFSFVQSSLPYHVPLIRDLVLSQCTAQN